MYPLRAVFSDVDGTLVHYRSVLEQQGYVYEGPILLDAATTGAGSARSLFEGKPVHGFRHTRTATLVPCVPVFSATLGGGFISIATLQLVESLRKENVLFIVMTGARTSTFLARRCSNALPMADYDVCEGGGRIYQRQSLTDHTGHAHDIGAPVAGVPPGSGSGVSLGNGDVLVWSATAAAHAAPIDGSSSSATTPPTGILSLDRHWLKKFETTTGSAAANLHMDPLSRVGPLWDVYRSLSLSHGYKLDANSFSTAFLVDARGARASTDGAATVSTRPTDEEEARLRSLFEAPDGELSSYGVEVFMNLGKGHVAPVGCNKRGALMHILEHENIEASHCAALFDDDNDLEFAEVCGFGGFVPSVAHGKVAKLVDAQPERFRRTEHEGLLGIEAALRALIDIARSAEPGSPGMVVKVDSMM